MQYSKNQIKSGFIWNALDSFGNQAINLVVNLTLASILGPASFGLVAMLSILIAIANIFVNGGFSSALIRKINRDEKDYSTAFYFSVLVSIVVYSIIFFISPFISEFYAQPELTNLTRLITLTIIINAFAIVPRTKLTVSLNFKNQAKANLFALIIGGATGVILAYNDFGVWSLVMQQIISAFISVVSLNILSPWKPVEPFCRERFKYLFGFGSKLLASSLLDAIYNNLYGLIIGKQFNATQLGIFNQANKISTLPATLITTVIQKVTYPMLSNMQDNHEKFDRMYLRILKISTLIIFPVMFGLCIVSEPLIDILLGDEWNASSDLISILTMALALYPIHAVNLNILQVKGRSDLFLKLEIMKKIIVTIALIVTVPMGVNAMCVGMVITSYLSLFVNTHYTGKLSTISQKKQFISLCPIGIITAISATIGYILGRDLDTNWLSIMVMLSTALFSYVVLIALFQKTLVNEIKILLKGV
ncbi:lipopolysaccharide biosynthesis protein [Vibrio cyclitrophicus]|uniref:lipopolysaccharide biosynthesis protein n=1 Tax=Vibrio cyclitrophicus TaxID=47951 RepID=UPI0032E44BE1